MKCCHCDDGQRVLLSRDLVQPARDVFYCGACHRASLRYDGTAWEKPRPIGTGIPSPDPSTSSLLETSQKD
jgi:hypothetical protein